MDDLDDLMGNNNNEVDVMSKKKDEPRDTLGFLKKSEEEKKRKEEERKVAASQKEAAYKQLSELTYNLTGYESETVYPYSTGPNISMQAKNQLKMQSKVEPITP
jgi:glucose-6-phosphate isomerase